MSALGSTESLYDTLLATAKAFVKAVDFEGTLDLGPVTTVLSPQYTHTWGHKDYISNHPHMREVLSRDALLAHLRGVEKIIQSIRTEITDTVVDTVKRKVVLRTTYLVQAKGVEEHESELNDLIWIFRMTKDGTKIEETIEFVDGDWSGRLGKKIAMGAAKLGQASS